MKFLTATSSNNLSRQQIISLIFCSAGKPSERFSFLLASGVDELVQHVPLGNNQQTPCERCMAMEREKVQSSRLTSREHIEYSSITFAKPAHTDKETGYCKTHNNPLPLSILNETMQMSRALERLHSTSHELLFEGKI